MNENNPSAPAQSRRASRRTLHSLRLENYRLTCQQNALQRQLIEVMTDNNSVLEEQIGLLRIGIAKLLFQVTGTMPDAHASPMKLLVDLADLLPVKEASAAGATQP